MRVTISSDLNEVNIWHSLCIIIQQVPSDANNWCEGDASMQNVPSLREEEKAVSHLLLTQIPQLG